VTRLKAFVMNAVEKASDEAQPYVALEHIASRTGRLLPGVELLEQSEPTAIAHQPGDVRFGKLRPYLAKSLLMDTAGIGSGELLVLRSRNGALDPRYLWYLTLSKPFLEWADVTSYGVKMPRTNWSILGAWDANVPSLAEQHRLVDLLDRQTGRIDDLVDEQLQLTILLQQHRASAIDRAIWGDRAENVPTVPLWRVADEARPIMYGIVLPGPNVPDGVLLVKGGDVRPERLATELLNRTTAEIEEPYSRARLLPGDILYAIRGSIGDAAVVPDSLAGANITQDVARIAPATGIDSQWLLYALQSPRFFSQMEREARGATIRGVNIWTLNKGRVPDVPLKVQHSLASRLGALDTRIGGLVDEIQRQIGLLGEHRQALITAAITGQLGIPGSAA
jgi:type I restriction enzyme S subunit